jgi:acetyltransferase
MTAHASSLDPLFAPRSVAVIGASAAPGKLGHAALQALSGFSGDVYAVNPRAAGPIERRPTFASVGEIGAPIDLALLCVPPQFTPDAIAECVQAGVRAGVLFTGGMAETGADGAELQRRITDTARAGGMRLLGPNTSGFLHPTAGVTMSFAPAVERIGPGPLGIVAQSGGVNLTLAWMAHAQGVGVSLAVGTGNAADVGPVDVLGYLAEDERTRAIMLHLEGTEDGRGLVDAIAAITPHKPVVALKVGRSDVAEFAASHTGALTGAWQLARSALAQAGAVVVDDTMQMLAAAHALAHRRARPSRSPGVGLVTGQAGPGLLVTDALRSAGVSVPELAPQTVAAIGDLLPPITFQRNPVDTARPDATFGAVTRLVADDPAIDVVAAYAIHEPTSLDPVQALETVTELPVVFITAGPEPELSETARLLEARGVAVIREPERGAQALAALVADARSRARRSESIAAPAGSVAVGRAALDEAAAKDVLDRLGIQTPARRVCATREEAHAALGELPAPLVVKILHADATHKTELGGVKLGVRDAAGLDAALDALDAIGLEGARYLVEETASEGIELILGGLRDPSFGPAVLVGVGGVAAEALQDVALRLAPLTRADAEEMLGELRARDLLDGHRGLPAADRSALADALVAIGELLVANDHVREIDVNPVRITAAGLVALDALIATDAATQAAHA